MSYWKSKVLPRIKKLLPGKKKAAAAEACKSFEASKESIEKELEEKKEELQPKVIEVYTPLDAEIKTIVKNPTEVAIKKQAQPVKKLLEELTKIEFPGASMASEAAGKYGPVLVLGPVTYVLQKAYTFIPEDVEEATPPVEAAPSIDTKTETETVPAEPETTVTTVVEETKTEEGFVEKVEKIEETKTEEEVVVKVETIEETKADDGKTVVAI
ncbi:hypothetical protein SUGI_0300740 [Cryptomeria japonica]|uniref:plasma membrane-associated cation-binding protein 1 n=1 Tax=Cryptomeria japonica TaxID=3369 RepID=UPI002408E99D|nr:plasma membrane-associated cation-binding protein 1 [Cryptomeria japonica]GLJ17321.1 hypothetical protein SUGI_0300740 [Cryptomeria japonica]